MVSGNVFVTICNGRVAVASNVNDAERQASEIALSTASELVLQAERNGEIRRSVSIRVCHVQVNQ